MSEISKRRGEFGEKVVHELLRIIGWEDPLSGREIECYRPQDHVVAYKDRKDHGVDFIYKYDCPLYANREVIALISSKLNDKYPSNPVSKFKSHIRDLAYASECFSKSNLRSKIKNPNFNITSKVCGVIFWIDNSNIYTDVIDRLTDFRTEDNLVFDSIYLIDNKRADFLFDAISFAQNQFQNKNIEFVHPSTGYNATPKQRISSSRILPVQYINSSILPLKISDEENDFLLLNCIDDFEEIYLKKLINLSHKLTENWGQKVYILFPDFNKDVHHEAVEDVKLTFKDRRFVSKIIVSSYRPTKSNVELRK